MRSGDDHKEKKRGKPIKQEKVNDKKILTKEIRRRKQIKQEKVNDKKIFT